MNITAAELQKIMPGVDPIWASAYAVAATNTANKFQINTPLRMAAWLAIIAYESGQLQYWREIGQGGGAFGDYYGRGPIQLTWRENYRLAGEYLNLDLLSDPDMVARSTQVGFDTAGWFWRHGNGDLNSFADTGDFWTCYLRVAGADNGTFNARKVFYDRALAELEEEGNQMTVSASDIVQAARMFVGSPYRWWDGSYPFTPGPAMYADWQNPGYYTPGYVRREGVNCLTGDTVVVSPEIERSYKRVYRGEVVSIETAGGHKLTGTPNHPILTPKGWQSLGSLVKSDYVISCPGFRQLHSSRVEPYDYRPPTPFQKIHDLFAETGALKRIPGIPLDFHGDGMHGEVDIIDALSELGERVIPSFFKQHAHLSLANANLDARALFPKSLAPHLLFGGRGASTSSVGGTGNSLSLLGRGLGMSELSGFGHTTTHTSLLEASANHLAGNPEAGRNLSLSLPGEVTADNIINVKRYAFHGEVYNLQTESGHYIANGIVTHNCTGLINLARMECGLEPIGGTGHYQDWLEASGTAEVFDPNTPGVPGALCVHRYEVGISEGHIALYSSSDAHTIIQSEAVNGVWEGDTDYASHQWADYEVYGLMPDVDYDATPIPAPGQEAEMWKWLAIDSQGWLRADGPDWSRGWHDREWTWHSANDEG